MWTADLVQSVHAVLAEWPIERLAAEFENLLDRLVELAVKSKMICHAPKPPHHVTTQGSPFLRGVAIGMFEQQSPA